MKTRLPVKGLWRLKDAIESPGTALEWHRDYRVPSISEGQSISGILKKEDWLGLIEEVNLRILPNPCNETIAFPPSRHKTGLPAGETVSPGPVKGRSKASK